MLPLEDSFNDILGKAQRGLKISDEALAGEASVSQDELKKVLGGDFDEDVVRKIAPVLKLDADRVVVSGKKSWHPGLKSFPAGLARTTTNYGDMTVNAYIVWDPASKDAVIFDTGADAGPLLEVIQKENLNPKLILITHTHGDHIADLAKLVNKTGAGIHVYKGGAAGKAKGFDWGETFSAGALKIDTKRTTGHAADGTTFVVSGLGTPVAVVGDAIFAGSMGGGGISYEEALRTNRESIFSLPDATLICPEHGPYTTVGLEKKNNPFYPEY